MFCSRLAEQGLPCPATIIEDEQHVVLDYCPAFQALRDEFVDRVPLTPITPDASMHDVMTCANQRALAAFMVRLHSLFTTTPNRTVDALACHVCHSAERASVMLICSGRCARGYHADTCLPAGDPLSRYEAWGFALLV